jgi:hypothetical protein
MSVALPQAPVTRVTKVAGESRCWTTAVALVLSLLVASCGDGGNDAAAKRPEGTASRARTPTAVADTNLDNAGATRVDILGDWLAAGARSV